MQKVSREIAIIHLTYPKTGSRITYAPWKVHERMERVPLGSARLPDKRRDVCPSPGFHLETGGP